MRATSFAPHHIVVTPEDLAGNGGLGRIVLLPGSDARARRIAERFDDPRTFPSPRQLNVYTGSMAVGDLTVDLTTVASGMGAASAEIVVSELLLLGARRFLRVGTAGSLQPARVRVGDCVIATAAVRDEHAMEAYAPREVPAVAHPQWVAALSDAAHDLGLAPRTFAGVVHSKDALYGRELGIGPLAARHADYMTTLQEMGVLATEMETSALFVLAAAHGDNVAPLSDLSANAAAVKAGAVLAVIGDDTPFAEAERIAEAEDRVIDLAIAAALRLARIERGA